MRGLRFSSNKVKYKLPRILLGSIFVVSGLNGFINFIPEQSYSPEGGAFIQNLKDSGFFWPLLKAAEIVGGILLLFGSMGQLGVLVLAPITVGIVLFHTFLSIEGAWLAYSLLALEIFLLILWRQNYAKMFGWSRKLTHESSAS